MEFPRKFFEQIVGPVLDSGQFDIEVRCLGMRHTNDPMFPEQFWFKSLSKLEKEWIEVVDRNDSGFDIHFTVVPRLREFHGKKEHPLPHALKICCVWADLDVGKGKPYKRKIDALHRVRDLKLLPNIVIESGSGLHLYWLIEPREIDRDRFERLLKSLAKNLDGDMGAARATRLMRVPHTFNWKYGKKGKRVRVRHLSKTRHRFKELERLWNEGDSRDESSAQNGEKQLTLAKFFAAHLQNFVVRGTEATALCPFHDDAKPSLSVNLSTGLWCCHSDKCRARGNLKQFCKRLRLPPPELADIQRFPRTRRVPVEDEWSAEKVFAETYRHFTGHVRFTHSWQSVVVTAWAMGTYLHRQFPCYGHLWINSPTTHSGKTQLLNVLWTVCFKAMQPQVEPTSAALFRFPSAIGGTLLLDEIDNLDPQKRSDVISVLNSYVSNGTVMRALPGKNKRFALELLPTYCPKVIAGIESLPVTLQDRCIRILLHRKSHSVKVKRFMPDAFQRTEELRNQLQAWAVRDAVRVIESYGARDELSVPADIDDRAKDILEPLFAVSSILPGCVRSKLIEAAGEIGHERQCDEGESNNVVAGLQVLQDSFPSENDVWKLRSEAAYDLFEEIPGIECKRDAQTLLRKLGFRSRSAKFGRKVLRAYSIPRRRLGKLYDQYVRGADAA